MPDDPGQIFVAQKETDFTLLTPFLYSIKIFAGISIAFIVKKFDAYFFKKNDSLSKVLTYSLI